VDPSHSSRYELHHSFGFAEDNPENALRDSIGLGDAFAAFTWVTGIGYIWKRWHAWRGTGCGCAARRHRWNMIRMRLPIAKVKL